MPLQRLDHFLVVASDLEATRAFYTDLLGLRTGPRPPFEFHGYWLYAGDTAVVHLAARGQAMAASDGAGALDHVAFAATGMAEMMSRLRRHGVEVRHRVVPDRGLQQLFLRDPDGVTIELTYAASEAMPGPESA